MLFSCDWFERQAHQITAPTVPTYKLSGYIHKISTGDSASDLELLIQQTEAYDLSYQDAVGQGLWIDQALTYTDEDGYFEYKGLLRGKYLLNIYYNDELIEDTFIGIINYEDREVNISVPL